MNRWLFYIPFSFIILGFYRNSWLPGGHSLYGKEIFIIFVISCFYLLLVMDFRQTFGQPIRALNGKNKYVFLLFILLLISIISYNLQEVSVVKNFIRLMDFVFFFMIFFLIQPRLVINNPEFFKRLVLIILFTGVITASLGLILLLSGVDPVPQFQGSLVSFIDEPNYVPFIFNLGIIASIFYLDWQKEKLSVFAKYFIVVSILIQLTALLFTLSRGAYIGLAFGIVTYLFVKYK